MMTAGNLTEVSGVGYLLQEVDIAPPYPTITLAAEEEGVGLIVRRGPAPIGFLLRPLPKGSRLTPEALAGILAAEAGPGLLEERLRGELLGAAVAPAIPTLSLAICTRERPDLLQGCLDYLLASTTASGESLADLLERGAAEVLVVDNAPGDGRTQALVAGQPHLRYLLEPIAGLDFARNRALREARGEVIAFVDDDTEVEPQWLAGLLAALAEHPDAVAITGLVLPCELATEAQVLFELRGGFRRGFRQLRFGPAVPSNPLYPCGAGIFGAGANMAFRREALLALGGFDEALDTGPPLPGGGDLDIFYRVIRSGGPLVYEPRMALRHRHRRDLEGLQRQYHSWGRGFMAFIAKSLRSDPAARRRLLLTILWWFAWQTGQLLKSFRPGRPERPRMVLAEIAGGVIGLFGEYRRSQRRVARRREQTA